jgi:hypothetical protein
MEAMILVTLSSFFALAATEGASLAFKITSTAFHDSKSIPAKYAHAGVTDGKNISLPFAWSGAPAGTKSFAFSIIDPHPVAKNWIHWFVIDIPDSTSSLREGASGKEMPAGSVELMNSYGEPGYGGPEPPHGSGAHPYVCTLYALKVAKLQLKPKSSLAEFTKALDGKVIATAKITGMFER